MPNYEVSYTYSIPMAGSVIVSANDVKSAEYIAERDINEDPDILDLEITGVLELKDGDERSLH